MTDTNELNPQSNELLIIEAENITQVIDDLFMLFPDKSTTSRRLRGVENGVLRGEAQILTLTADNGDYILQRCQYWGKETVDIYHIIFPQHEVDNELSRARRLKITYEMNEEIPYLELFTAEGTPDSIEFWRSQLSDPEIESDEYENLKITETTSGLEVNCSAIKNVLLEVLESQDFLRQ